MKRFLRITILTALSFAAIGWLTACPGTVPVNPTTPAQLAPGYSNTDDQKMGIYLSGANAFAKSIQQQVAAGTLTMTATVKAGFNEFILALNAADSVYLSYHNGTATEAQAKTLSDAAQAKQNALPLPGAK